MSRRSSALTRKLRIESLERKLPLAADFTGSLLQAELIDGDLVITNLDQNFNVDDLASNPQLIRLAGDNLGALEVTVENAQLFDPVSGVTFESGETLSLTGFTGGVSADFGSELAGLPGIAEFGLVTEGSLDIGGDVTVTGSADEVSFAAFATDVILFEDRFTIDGSVSVSNLGPGLVDVDIEGGEIIGDLAVDAPFSTAPVGGALATTVDLAVVDVAGDVTIDIATAEENETVVTHVGVVGGDFTINSEGAAADTIQFFSSDLAVGDTLGTFLTEIGGTLEINTDGGDDLILVNFDIFTLEQDSIFSTLPVDEFRVDAGAGDDVLLIAELEADDRIDISLGAGDDELTVLDGQISTIAIPADFSVSSGAGQDTISISDFATGDDFLIRLDGGEDTVALEGLTAPDDLRFSSGSGITEVTIEEVELGDDLVLDLGAGDDEFEIEGVIVGDEVTVSTGGGENNLSLAEGSTVGGGVQIDGGDDRDIIGIGGGTDVRRDVVINGAGGDDSLSLDGVTVHDDVILYGGDGDDSLMVALADIRDNLFVFAGAGADEVVAEESQVGNDFWLFTSGGDDEVEGSGLQVGDDFRILTGSGNDQALFEDLHVNDLLLLNTGSGDDVASITDSTVDVAIISLGSGADSLALGGVTIEDFGLLLGGSGLDTLEDLGGNDFSSSLAVIDLAFEEEIDAA